MDALVRLHAAAQPLLARVDATLASLGVPGEHPIVPLLRRRGLLPGDAVANVVAWGPEPLRERAGLLRAHRERSTALDDQLRPPSTWEGPAAVTFAARLDTARHQHDVLAENAAMLARYLEELADWIDRGRTGLAHTLATAMSSTPCVILTTVQFAGAGFDGSSALAAADLGADILASADALWMGALDISDAWSARLETVAPAPPPGAPATAHTLRVDL